MVILFSTCKYKLNRRVSLVGRILIRAVTRQKLRQTKWKCYNGNKAVHFPVRRKNRGEEWNHRENHRGQDLPSKGQEQKVNSSGRQTAGVRQQWMTATNQSKKHGKILRSVASQTSNLSLSSSGQWSTTICYFYEGIHSEGEIYIISRHLNFCFWQLPKSLLSPFQTPEKKKTDSMCHLEVRSGESDWLLRIVVRKI